MFLPEVDAQTTPFHKFKNAIHAGALLNRAHHVETLHTGIYNVLETLEYSASTFGGSMCTQLRKLHVGSGGDPMNSIYGVAQPQRDALAPSPFMSIFANAPAPSASAAFVPATHEPIPLPTSTALPAAADPAVPVLGDPTPITTSAFEITLVVGTTSAFENISSFESIPVSTEPQATTATPPSTTTAASAMAWSFGSAPSLFEASAAGTTTSLFGTPAAGATTSLFGAPVAGATTSIFGTQSTLPRYPISDHPVDLSFLIKILRQNNHLRVLSLQGRLLDRFGGVTGDIVEVFSAFPAGLERLRLNGYRGYSVSSHIGPITDQRANNHGSGSSQSSPSLPPLPQTLHALRQLHVLNYRINDALLVSLIERCPNLQALRLVTVRRRVVHPDISMALQRCCPRLDELCLSGELGTDEDLARMISVSTTGWVTLAIPSRVPYSFHQSSSFGVPAIQQSVFGPLSTAALLQHTSTIENLFLEHCAGFASKNIQRFLCSATRLRRFSILSSGTNKTMDAKLSVWDLVVRGAEEWACRSLETFHCLITNVPRPDVPFRLFAVPDPENEEQHQLDLEESYKVQRKVYSRLAQLTRLRELVLGNTESTSFLDGSPKYLSMSLESGLDLLAGLKELQIVDCDKGVTCFWNLPEQEWVQDHWPKYDTGHPETFWIGVGCFDSGTGILKDPLSD
ncbi:hypothetical protein BGX23_006515 [Mortierella sp. AD031]|nr:hypothetical protein BGX23_006515 [Mortierella sp. AD031]